VFLSIEGVLMRRFICLFLVITFPPLSVGCSSMSTEEIQPKGQVRGAAVAEPGQLDENARSSLDSLIDEFVEALSTNDKKSLTRLRVTEREYLDIIVPGTVPVGAEPRHNSPKVKEFWVFGKSSG
jgi:hypothetical protein